MSTGEVDRILLFGSQATGSSVEGSDIDLLVILGTDTIPSSYRERSANYLQISRAIRDIEKKHPIDVMVYTRPEFKKLRESGSLFIQRILREGVPLA